MQHKLHPEILSYQVRLWKCRNSKRYGVGRYYRIRDIPLGHLQEAINSMADIYADCDMEPYKVALDLLYKELARRADKI